MGQRKIHEDSMQAMLHAAMFGAGRPRGGWRSEARCQGLDPADFYPDAVEDAAVPLRVCHLDGGCAVRAECLEAAEEWGIWGGTTEWDRRQFRKMVRAA